MKVIEKYVSMDGKEFNTADECVQYEEKVFNDNTLRLYTGDGRRIPNTDIHNRFYEIYGIAWESLEAYDRLRKSWDEYPGNFNFPRREHGAYIFVDYEEGEGWFNYFDIMAKADFWRDIAKRFDNM